MQILLSVSWNIQFICNSLCIIWYHMIICDMQSTSLHIRSYSFKHFLSPALQTSASEASNIPPPWRAILGYINGVQGRPIFKRVDCTTAYFLLFLNGTHLSSLWLQKLVELKSSASKAEIHTIHFPISVKTKVSLSEKNRMVADFNIAPFFVGPETAAERFQNKNWDVGVEMHHSETKISQNTQNSRTTISYIDQLYLG